MARPDRRFRNLRHFWLQLQNNVVAKWGVRKHKGPASAWRFGILERDVHQMKRYFRAGIPATGLSSPSMDSLDTLINQNRYQELRWVLLRGANPNAKNTNNYSDSLIHRAAAQGRRDMVRLLVKLGASLEQGESNGYSALAVALNGCGEYRGPWERRRLVVLDLLELGASATAFTRRQRESVLLQLAELDAEVMDGLIAAGANPNQVYNPVPEPGWEDRVEEPSLLFHGQGYWGHGERLEKWLAFMDRTGLDLKTRSRSGMSLAWTILTQSRPSLENVPGIIEALKAGGAWELVPSSPASTEPLFITFLKQCPDHWWAWTRALLDEPAFRASLNQPNSAGETVQAWLARRTPAVGSIYHKEAGRLRAALIEEQLPAVSPEAKPRLRF